MIDRSTSLRNGIAEVRAFISEINKEINAFNQTYRSANDVHANRMTVRVLFGCLEAWISMNKKAILAWHGPTLGKLTREEWLALQDKEERTDKYGTKSVHTVHRGIKDDVRLVIEHLPKIGFESVTLDFSKGGGARFCEAVKIRHRAIHPQFVKDWNITEREKRDVKEAWDWLVGIMFELSGKK